MAATGRDFSDVDTAYEHHDNAPASSSGHSGAQPVCNMSKDALAPTDDDDDDSSHPPYGDGPEYWDDRYTRSPEPFEWLESYDDLSELIDICARGNIDAKILNVGCGNSLIAEGMYDAGYANVVSIDNSSVVVNQMTERDPEQRLRPGLVYLCRDATRMDFPSGHFDLIVDKSLLDTFACSEHPLLTIARYLAEVVRVLTPYGILLCVSYGTLDTRSRFLKLPHLGFEVKQLDLPPNGRDSQQHFAYVCTKTAEADELLRTWWPHVEEALRIDDSSLPGYDDQ